MTKRLTREEIYNLPEGSWFQLHHEPGIRLVDFLMYKNGVVYGRMPEFEFSEHSEYLWEISVESVEIATPVQKQTVDFKELYQRDSKQGAYVIAKDLVDKYHVKTLTGNRDRVVYIYDQGFYRPGLHDLRSKIQEVLEELASMHVKNEIMEKVKDLTPCDRKSFNVNPDLINFKNGVLNIRTSELMDHDPKQLFLHQIPITFDKNADCHVVKKFLKEVLQEKDMDVIQEWLGFGLYRSYFIKKAIILVGERDTGKTTLLNLFATFVGVDNLSGVSLQKIASDKFAAAYLYGKHINIYDDLSFKDINDNGAFKIATGGGMVSAEYKFGDQFQFENYSKLMFACNKIPDVKDANDEAYFSRWIVIPFNKKISRADKFLGSRLKDPLELSGLLNFALEGLSRLLTNHQFSYDKDPDDIKAEMMKSGSVIANFAYDGLEKENGAWISREKMYEAFVEYATDNNLPVETQAKFGRKIQDYANYMTDSKRRDNSGKLVTGWLNVKVKSLDNELLPTEDLIREIIDI